MANIAITGAARGIGLELVRQYAANGDRVFALCRTPSEALNAVAAASGGKVTIHDLDVGSDESVKAGAASTGTDNIDVLLNVAGVTGPTEPELELGSSDWAAWQDALNIMVMGPLRVMQAFLPRMQAGAKVINFSSQLAASTWPYGGYYAYVAAKAGLNRVMRSAALDLKDRGIIIGLVHPGWVQTDMGGPDAEITTVESAIGIRKVTADWTIERSGDFLKWNGETHPW
ncbi:SDR family oxidoreductase [Aquisediminimonas sediminicola]|uniref:SDR family oxidoreductase n=1 Tax=Alteraquisediminimonas sediminicola TaxID=2676787 RepID=UPI001C8ED583|nr:SDR family oxidoreductase [Aquisediminimonas sediminicola]